MIKTRNNNEEMSKDKEQEMKTGMKTWIKTWITNDSTAVTPGRTNTKDARK